MTYLERLLQNLLENAVIKAILSSFAGVLAAVFGPWTPVHTAALVFIVGDQLTGTWAAMRDGEFSPTHLRKATGTKLIIYGMVFVLAFQVTAICDHAGITTPALGKVLLEGRLLLHMVAIWIALTEWESIGKHINHLGYKWPTINGLIRLLHYFRKE